MVPLRRLLAAKLPLADKDMLAARTSRHPSGGRPHFSAAVIECGPAGTRCAHSTPYAEKNLALGAVTRQIRPHSMSALVSARRQRGLHAHEKGPDP